MTTMTVFRHIFWKFRNRLYVGKKVWIFGNWREPNGTVAGKRGDQVLVRLRYWPHRVVSVHHSNIGLGWIDEHN